ncbi:right-handed parallel beta-helix repeat-containing protein [Bacillus sp. FJAT-29790]|uniref:right-handed parallel beta-helix repeat-containing protein n=1 Tax=Bacillus sp. FJAT-29790 TaxID=1895002 RepID=UPI001C216076|nr:NosD domain-containing protein [Bacillus sp. FJAT-29790]MBU8878314.1 right-handed parallel beta-helix repeat-containing protein [Bacillus sp. FJAT-29790]
MYYRSGLFFLFFWVLLAGKVYAEELTVSNTEELFQALSYDREITAIKLKPGEYVGNFIVSEPVHIFGEKGAKLIGPNNGYVLTVESSDVIVEGLQVEGGGSQNAGIYVKGDRAYIHHNEIKNVFHGIYARDSYGHRFENNVITSFPGDRNYKGYGIYFVSAPNSLAVGNYIHDTQDGIYVSFSDFCEVRENQMIRARYGVHTMDSKNILISQNEVRESINGLMIMQSYEVFIIENFFYLNTAKNGTGMFIYDTFDSKISSNMIKGNFKGILMENAQRNRLEFNTILENDTGLELRKKSNGNTISFNNFLENTNQIITDKDNVNQFNKDNFGNFYSDHGSLNLNNDDLVDFAYKSGNIFYNIAKQEPLLQVFHQSPAVNLWNMVEQYTPMPSDSFIVDEFPLAKPAPVNWKSVSSKGEVGEGRDFQGLQIFIFMCVLLGSTLILFTLRRARYEA